MLELAPETENAVRDYAAREGVSVNALVARTFPRPVIPAETPEETAERVKNLLHKWQAEYGLPVPPGGFKSVAELFDEWAAEDANLTEEEIAAERAFWEERERDFDHRRGVEI